ncbi:hypothetical protein ACET3Z_029538 [Daucus carota]
MFWEYTFQIRSLDISVGVTKMFLKAQLQWNVVVPAEKLDKGLSLKKEIVVRLLDTFAATKATSSLGYLLAVTTLENLEKGKVKRDTSGDVVFPVTFSCMTYKIFVGEIVEAEVHKILKQGVFLRCGPVENIFLSRYKMKGYKFVAGENAIFVSEESGKIEKGMKLRVEVISVKYMEVEKEFQALANLNGDFLGPI